MSVTGINKNIFITGIGTNVGKSFVSSIMVNALKGDYWKPIQSGLKENTDSDFIRNNSMFNPSVYEEEYKLANPISPHHAARQEKIKIKIEDIKKRFEDIRKHTNNFLIIEGAGGLLSPINEKLHNIDLITQLNLQTVIVSRNYLGSINHSLMTAEILKYNAIKTIGWVFIDYDNSYQKDIIKWSGINKIFSFNSVQQKDLVTLNNTSIYNEIKKFLTVC